MTMTDLIRRADAIEAVRKELVCDGRHETHDKTCRFIADVLLSALPSADAVSMEEHVKELNDLAVEWKAKFAKAEKITDGIYDETMAKVAKECEECKERLRNIHPSTEAVQGEWVEKGGEIVCSVCGNSVSFSRTPKGWVLGRFCQTCGAKMKGGAE